MEIGSLGVPELLIILVVVLLLFGPRRLPEVSRGLGKAVRNFRKGLEGSLDELREPERPEPRAEPAAPAEAAADDGGASDGTTVESRATGSGSSKAPEGDPPSRAV